MNSPWGVGLLSNGDIVVSEFGRKRLQIFEGNFIRIMGAGQLANPLHLFVDSLGG